MPKGREPQNGTIDIGIAADRLQLSVDPEEHPEERAVRLAGEARAKLIEDYKGVAVFALVLFFVSVVAAVSGYIVFFSNSPPDTAKYAQTLLTSLISGGTGFLFGKAIAK